MNILGGDDGDPLVHGPVPDLALHPAADTDLHHAFWVDQPLVDGDVEIGAVSHRGQEILFPGVHMGVEMDQAQGAVFAGRRPQQGQGYQVISAEGDEIGRASCRERV